MIKNYRYLTSTNELVVEFSNGSVYGYQDVPIDIFKSIVSSDHPSKMIRHEIINQFQNRKIITPLIYPEAIDWVHDSEAKTVTMLFDDGSRRIYYGVIDVFDDWSNCPYMVIDAHHGND